jgi:hypothetical protein
MLSIEELKELESLLLLAYPLPDKMGMVAFCMKKDKYVHIGNMYIDVCDDNPSIAKTIYYDDTRSDPGSSKTVFLHANKMNMPEERELQTRNCGYRELYICVHYWNDKTNGRLVSLQSLTEEEAGKDTVIRKVTAPELLIINEAIRESKDKYAKRLEAYYKRYGQHVRSSGYWADR